MSQLHVLAGLLLAGFGSVSLLMPLGLVHRLDGTFRSYFDGHFGEGSFVMLHRVLSIVVILFGIALAMRIGGL